MLKIKEKNEFQQRDDTMMEREVGKSWYLEGEEAELETFVEQLHLTILDVRTETYVPAVNSQLPLDYIAFKARITYCSRTKFARARLQQDRV